MNKTLYCSLAAAAAFFLCTNALAGSKNGGFYENNGLLLLPPMALIGVGLIIWVQRSRNKKLIGK